MWKRLHVKYALFLSGFKEILNFLYRFSKISNIKLHHYIAHTRCMLDKQGYMHTRTRARAYSDQYGILIAFQRERASLLRYTYLACLV